MKENSLENIVRINYLSSLIEEKELIDYESKLKEVGLELSLYDHVGKYSNSVEELVYLFSLTLPEYIIPSLIQVGPNAMWDVVKYVMKKIYKTIKGKKYTTLQGGEFKEKTPTIGLNIGEFHLSMTGLSEEGVDKSLDKVLLFLSKEFNTNSKVQCYTRYDEKKGIIEEINIFEEINKKRKKKK